MVAQLQETLQWLDAASKDEASAERLAGRSSFLPMLRQQHSEVLESCADLIADGGAHYDGEEAQGIKGNTWWIGVSHQLQVINHQPTLPIVLNINSEEEAATREKRFVFKRVVFSTFVVSILVDPLTAIHSFFKSAGESCHRPASPTRRQKPRRAELWSAKPVADLGLSWTCPSCRARECKQVP